ncbi:MAG: Hsp20/alpha crystallin family protein [Caldilineae bacterium]|nr:MAG: Hsp20/alpha crystallin family protein [Caldilineae bacterium]
MTALTQWNPYREIMEMRAAMDRLFDEAFFRPFAFNGSHLGLALDVAETEDAYIIEAAIPGINPDELDISLTQNVLTIKGEIKKEEEVEEGRYHLRERRFGKFSRSVTLPGDVQADAVEATYQNGVLRLVAPKAEEAKPKHIKVSAPKTIEGEKVS